jgi:hypothetical protein
MALNSFDIALDGPLAVYCWRVRPSESQAKAGGADDIKCKFVKSTVQRRDVGCVAGDCGPIIRLDHIPVYARRFLPHKFVCIRGECRLHDTSMYSPLIRILTDKIFPEDRDAP